MEKETLNFLAKPLGINTVLGANQLEQDELVAATNWMFLADGKLTTRPGLEQITNTALPEKMIYSTDVGIGGVNYTMCVDASHNLYYLDTNYDPVFIATLEGKPTIISFESYAVIMDTGFLKTWDGTTFRMAYDEGTGLRGYQFDNASSLTTGSIAVGNTTNYRVATKFTSQDWTSDYTLLPRAAVVKLEKTGAPTGNFYVRLRRVSDGFILAENDTITGGGVTVTSVADISGTATDYTVSFAVVSEMEPSTDYYLSIEYTSGDASNYLKVHYATATAGQTYIYSAGAYSLDATKNIISSFQPGKPPKASFGLVAEDRLYLAGGSDYPGWAWYTNVNTPYDTSTLSGGGYIGVIDNDANNFPIGGILLLYGKIWLIGTQRHPFFAVLEGSGPDDYIFKEKFRYLSTNHHTVLNGINDGFFANTTGVYSMSGVEQYGDVRLGGIAKPVRNIFNGYFNDNAFSGFDPSLGLYIIKLENRQETLVCHTNIVTKEIDGYRRPWTLWDFPWTPESFNFSNGEFRIGMENGHLYKLNPLIFSDEGTRPRYTITSAMVEMPIADADITNVYISGQAYGDTGTFDLEIYFPTDDALVELEPGLSFEEGLSFETSTGYAIPFESDDTPYEDNPDYITNKVQWSIDNVTMDKFDLSSLSMLFRRLQE